MRKPRKSLKNRPYFEGKSLKWVPFLAKITLKDGYGYVQLKSEYPPGPQSPFLWDNNPNLFVEKVGG